ncbi:MAG: hypothetical protein NXI13_00235 [Proteobacteria bacterium]|nr:hypothetical protein [Pseudomonadota bacterium]
MSEQSDQTPGPNFTLLKWIVGILGVLIVIFAVVIAVTIYKRLTATDTAEMSTEITTSSTMGYQKQAQFGDIRVPIPEDMDVISMTAGNDRLFMVFGTEGVARIVLVISLMDGEVLGTLTLGREGIQ